MSPSAESIDRWRPDCAPRRAPLGKRRVDTASAEPTIGTARDNLVCDRIGSSLFPLLSLPGFEEGEVGYLRCRNRACCLNSLDKTPVGIAMRPCTVAGHGIELQQRAECRNS